MTQDGKPQLVTCYVDPDLDGTAGAIAYAEFLQKNGKQAVAGILGEPHEEAKYILDRFGLEYPNQIAGVEDFDKVILVDASDLHGLEGKIPPEKVVEIIDHRKVHEADKFPNAQAQIEFVGSAATLVAEKFMQSEVEISQRAAILLYGAIVSNTLNFKGSITTDRDTKAAEWLNRVAKLPESFWEELFLAKSDLSGVKLAQRIEHDFAWFDIGDKKFGIAQIEMIGARELVNQREKEILKVLQKIGEKMKLDFTFLTIIELEGGFNVLVTDEKYAQGLLERALGVKFSGNFTERPGMIMRKQIVPLLKSELVEE